MAEVLKKFGRYFLLDQIAQGGMAEIYRARPAQAENAGRLLVIKRIQAGYGANAEFRDMFQSEIKVTMGFNHPNIVQVYDFGEEQSQPYIAMELVDGKNLRQFLLRFAELKKTFPVELATYIIEQAASGLHYAHSFRDKISGEPLNVVHRDISPQNVLISYDGNVKVIDFGIAKATTNNEATRAGVIKGKPSYLSPEQITGETLDARCDIFALGAVLWELLVGKKLFSGENDLAVLKLIEGATQHVKPPSTLNPSVPKELDAIVMKALVKQREKRYQTAEELQRALHRFLYGFNPEFNPADLSYYAKDMFKNEIVDDRKLIQRLNEKVEQLLAHDAEAQAREAQAASGRKEDTTTIVDSGKGARPTNEFTAGTALDHAPLEIERSRDAGFSQPSSQSPQPSRPHGTVHSVPGQRQSSPSGHGQSSSQQSKFTRSTRTSSAPIQIEEAGGIGRWAAIAAGVALVAGIVAQQMGIPIPIPGLARNKDTQLVLKGDSPRQNVVVTVNGEKVSTVLPSAIVVPSDTPLKLMITGDDGDVFQQEVTVARGEHKVVRVPASSVPASDASKTIVLRLNISPNGSNGVIQINGRPMDPLAPVSAVPVDAPLELTIERPGYRTLRKDFTLDSRQIGNLKEWVMNVELEPTKFGLLTLRTTPSAEATLMLDGKPWVRRTPIENEKIPVGTYNVRLANEALGMEKTLTITVQDGKAISLDERLAPRN
jgi:serine/threonine protein kinase